MIWNIATIHTVRNLYTQSAVSEESIQQSSGDSLSYTRELLAKRLKHEARVYAVEIDVTDVQFQERDGEFDTRLIRANWAPQTRTVQFRGGQEDGRLMEVSPQLLFTRIVFHSNPVSPCWQESDVPVTLSENVAYDYAGWNEADRVWVYDCV